MNETRQSCGQVNPRTGASRSLAFRKIRLAVAAIDGGAKKLGVSGREMYERLDRQGLIHRRLLGAYDILHTQGEKWVVEDTVETLKNWEAEG